MLNHLQRKLWPLAGARMDCDCACAAPPDYSGVAAANEKSAEYAYKAANEDLAFRKQVYEESKPHQLELEDLAQRVVDQQMGIADTSEARAQDQWEEYNRTYKPVERQTVMDSMGANYLGADDKALMAKIINGTSGLSEEQITSEIQRMTEASQSAAADQAMTRAAADVNNAYGQQARMLMRLGGDPAKIVAASRGLAQQQSLAQVGAANDARNQAYGQGVGLRTGVANFGRNMPNTAGQAFGLAAQTGNSAVANASQGFQAGLPYAQFASGAYGTQMGAAGLAQQGALGLGQLMSRDYATAQAGYGNMGNDGGMGQLLGAGIGAAGAIFSDRRLKENVELVGAHAGLPLYAFNYITVPDRRFVGVMADDVERVLPDAVTVDADGYKLVNYSMLGLDMVELENVSGGA